MLVLGLDCTGDTFSVAVSRGTKCLAETSGMRARTHLTFLMPALLETCRRAGVELKNVDGVAVTVGPGAFTGVRLGILTARTLAQSLGLALAGVPTLEALALNLPEGSRGITAVDARRGEIYSAAYHVHPDRLEELAPSAARTPEQVRELGDLPVLGNALARYRFERPLGERLWTIRGACVAELGRRRLERGRTSTWLELEPLYLRPPDVQVHA